MVSHPVLMLIAFGLALPIGWDRVVVSPTGVPIRMVEGEPVGAASPVRATQTEDDDGRTAHSAEGDLTSEVDEIDQQARRSLAPEAGQDLLE